MKFQIKCPTCRGTGQITKVANFTENHVRQVMALLLKQDTDENCIPGCLGHLDRKAVADITRWGGGRIANIGQYLVEKGILAITTRSTSGRPALIWHLFSEQPPQE